MPRLRYAGAAAMHDLKNDLSLGVAQIIGFGDSTEKKNGQGHDHGRGYGFGKNFQWLAVFAPVTSAAQSYPGYYSTGTSATQSLAPLDPSMDYLPVGNQIGGSQFMFYALADQDSSRVVSTFSGPVLSLIMGTPATPQSAPYRARWWYLETPDGVSLPGSAAPNRGKFRPGIRNGGSPNYNTLAGNDADVPLWNASDTPVVKNTSRAFAANAAGTSVEARWCLPGASTSLTPPYYLLGHSFERDDIRTGAIMTSIWWYGGNGLVNWQTRMTAVGAQRFANLFSLLKQNMDAKNSAGYPWRFWFSCTPGLNDRGLTADQYETNFRSFIATVAGYFDTAGIPRSRVRFLIGRPHPVATAPVGTDDALLEAFFQRMCKVARERTDMVVYDPTSVLNGNELKLSTGGVDGYDNSVGVNDDPNHLKTAGEELLWDRVTAGCKEAASVTKFSGQYRSVLRARGGIRDLPDTALPLLHA